MSARNKAVSHLFGMHPQSLLQTVRVQHGHARHFTPTPGGAKLHYAAHSSIWCDPVWPAAPHAWGYHEEFGLSITRNDA